MSDLTERVAELERQGGFLAHMAGLLGVEPDAPPLKCRLAVRLAIEESIEARERLAEMRAATADDPVATVPFRPGQYVRVLKPHDANYCRGGTVGLVVATEARIGPPIAWSCRLRNAAGNYFTIGDPTHLEAIPPAMAASWCGYAPPLVSDADLAAFHAKAAGPTPPEDPYGAGRWFKLVSSNCSIPAGSVVRTIPAPEPSAFKLIRWRDFQLYFATESLAPIPPAIVAAWGGRVPLDFEVRDGVDHYRFADSPPGA